MYNILDFGAPTDGATLCTDSIQKAIDACHANGGGRVVIPTGTFVSGSVYLKDNVELHLERGALLKASPDMDDYNPDDAYPQNFGSVNEKWRAKHLIIAVEKKNVAITGFGEINGNGEAFFEECHETDFYGKYAWRDGVANCKDKEVMRPGQLICFVECEHVTLEDITVRDATCWCCFFHGCEHVRIRGICVYNPSYWLNTDGIDIDCCRYVTVSDCIILTGDDSFAIRCDSQKLKNPKPCEFITITNCVCSASASGIRVGVGVGQIRHVRVSNMVFKRAGAVFNLQTSYNRFGEAFIEDVNFSNVTAVDVCFPWRFNGSEGEIKDVTIENYRVHCLGYGRVTALGDCNMENINFRNVDIFYRAEERELTADILKYRGVNLLEVENAKNVTFDGVNIFVDEKARPTWENDFADKNSTGTVIKNCNF